MKVEVSRLGLAVVHRVEVFRHPDNLHSVWIDTPQIRRPVCAFGCSADPAHHFGVSLWVDVFRGAHVAESPTRVELIPETAGESESIQQGFFELDAWRRFGLLLVTIPLQVVERRRYVCGWDNPALQSTDYLIERDLSGRGVEL